MPTKAPKLDQARLLRELSDFLSIPSISALPSHATDCRAAADWLVKDLKRLGCPTVELLEGNGHPCVWAESPRVEGAPTLLIYGHYDVQPVDPVDEWVSPPFAPTVRDGKLFARGSADDKGQVFCLLRAYESVLKDGKPPVNVNFIFEGEEECGGHVIDDVLQRARSLIDRAIRRRWSEGLLTRDPDGVFTAFLGAEHVERLLQPRPSSIPPVEDHAYGATTALGLLTARLHLSPAETDLLAVLLCCETDPATARLMNYLGGNQAQFIVTVDLIFEVVFRSRCARQSEAASLLQRCLSPAGQLQRLALLARAENIALKFRAIHLAGFGKARVEYPHVQPQDRARPLQPHLNTQAVVGAEVAAPARLVLKVDLHGAEGVLGLRLNHTLITLLAQPLSLGLATFVFIGDQQAVKLALLGEVPVALGQ